MSPLNPILHAALHRKFKNIGDVRVANEGIRNEWHFVLRGEKKRREIKEFGEQYRVNCPFCSDGRHRLYLNYEFGTLDPDGRVMLGIAECFNENCLTMNPDNRETLFHEVLWGRPVARAHVSTGSVKPPARYIEPGDTTPLHLLDKDHVAVQYLKGRGFEVGVLSRIYGLSWCSKSPMDYAESRIIIPFIQNGKMIGWKARYPYNGDFFTSTGHKIPRYFNMPGMNTSEVLYNWDHAKRYKTIILVEGELDALKQSGPAVGILGKSLSSHNANRIVNLTGRTGATVVVALDPDKDETDKKGLHPIERVCNKLKERDADIRLLPLYLPLGTDPANYTKKEFQRLLHSAAAEKGMRLEF